MDRKASSSPPDANRVRTERPACQLLDVAPQQVRAARGLLGWSAERLSKAAGVGLRDLAAFERDGYLMGAVDYAKVQRALTQAGVRFIGPSGDFGRGVRLASPPQGVALIIARAPKSRETWV